MKKALNFAGAFIFVVFSLLIGQFMLPFIAWCTAIEVVVVLSCITGFVCFVGLLIALGKRSKTIAAIVIPIFLSAGLNNLFFSLRTGYSIYATDDYLRGRRGLYTKFGVQVVAYDWNEYLAFAYTERGEKAIAVWKSDYSGVWSCNVYDADGDFIDSFTGRGEVKYVLECNGYKVPNY